MRWGLIVKKHLERLNFGSQRVVRPLMYCVVRLSTITVLKTSYECNSTSWTNNERMKESTPGCSITCWYTHYKNLTCHNFTSYPTTTQPTNNHIEAEFTWSTLVIEYFPWHAFSSLPYVNNVKYCISSHSSLHDQRHCGKIQCRLNWY